MWSTISFFCGTHCQISSVFKEKKTHIVFWMYVKLLITWLFLHLAIFGTLFRDQLIYYLPHTVLDSKVIGPQAKIISNGNFNCWKISSFFISKLECSSTTIWSYLWDEKKNVSLVKTSIQKTLRKLGIYRAFFWNKKTIWVLDPKR